MKDACRVEILGSARRDLIKVSKRDSAWSLAIESVIEAVAVRGWVVAAQGQLVKVLDQKQHVGEIRLPGKGGYRLLFFWLDDADGRTLWITAMVQKKDVEDTRRLNAYVEAAAERRRHFLENRGKG